VNSALQLGQVVLKDAAMTARVLKLANSAHYNTTGQKFSTISRAIMMLGFDTVRSMCLTVSLIDSLVHGIHRDQLIKQMGVLCMRRLKHRKWSNNKVTASIKKCSSPHFYYISEI
jgi:c-di-GMP-related signal transduction protein